VTDYYSSLQKLENRADLFSQFTTYFDDPGRIEREADPYLEVTPEEIVEVARACFDPSQRVVLSILPREPAG
jgi:predicted Zn-dependent peptidase